MTRGEGELDRTLLDRSSCLRTCAHNNLNFIIKGWASGWLSTENGSEGSVHKTLDWSRKLNSNSDSCSGIAIAKRYLCFCGCCCCSEHNLIIVTYVWEGGGRTNERTNGCAMDRRMGFLKSKSRALICLNRQPRRRRRVAWTELDWMEEQINENFGNIAPGPSLVG